MTRDVALLDTSWLIDAWKAGQKTALETLKARGIELAYVADVVRELEGKPNGAAILSYIEQNAIGIDYVDALSESLRLPGDVSSKNAVDRAMMELATGVEYDTPPGVDSTTGELRAGKGVERTGTKAGKVAGALADAEIMSAVHFKVANPAYWRDEYRLKLKNTIIFVLIFHLFWVTLVLAKAASASRAD